MNMRSERRALDKIYKRRDRYEIPDWQREEVWSTAKKAKLIDSILRGWKLPKFYFQKTSESPDEFDVVDGQQRLTAIWEFFDGDLALPPKSAAEFGADRYADLPDALSDAFDDYEIEYDEITDATDEEVKEFFQRLQEGLPLNSSEKLNSIHSKLRDFCASLAEHEFFSNTTVLADKRYAYFDVAAKVVTLEIEDINSGLRYQDVRQVFENNAGFSSQSAAAKRTRNALNLLHEVFPGSFTPFRNRTIVQSIVTLTCHLQQAGMPRAQGKNLATFIDSFLTELRKQVELGQGATDPDFLRFQRTVNANIKSAARTRQDVLLRKLLREHPKFFSFLSQSSTLSSGIEADIERISVSIRKLIASTNDRNAASTGKDLFKPTNKTATAIAEIGVPISTLEEYKALVEHLYFIFHEGVGQRLASKVPPAFADLSDLRTMLQHDVDHGKPGKVASKRKNLAQTFSKYSGLSSPEALDPAQFLLVQVNLLGALEADLQLLS